MDIRNRIISVSIQMLAILVLMISLHRDTWQVNGQICNTPGWLDFGDSQYLIVNEGRTWDNANGYCQDKGGHLAIITSHEQNTFLVTYSTKYYVAYNYWIGLRDEDGDGQYTWINSTQPDLMYSNWLPSEPLGRYRCVGMRSTYSILDLGGWQTDSCNAEHVHICQRPKDSRCLWQRFGQSLYRFFDEEMSYEVARAHCMGFGGDLAIIKSKELNNFLVGFLPISNPSACFWLGLNREYGQDDSFIWVDGTAERRNESSWAPGEPNGAHEDCACMYDVPVTHVRHGKWNDLPCSDLSRPYICETPQGCPPGKWNLPICNRLCDYCYNGGMCNTQTGACICTPGFTGKNCLTACGDQRFGFECELVCGSAVADDSPCGNNKFCPSDPNECSCIAGYAGPFCSETCRDGQFGSDCLLDCQCKDGMPCDVFTGRCEEGCAPGWLGEGCQVPSVCPVGYFGVNCTDHCNCPDNVGCDKVSGFCMTTEGQCEVGFTSDSVDLPDSCNTFTGCYNWCSRTCHCRDGEDDCNSVTGSCSSGRCHPRWTGQSCQTDRFYSAREKTNPGVAIFSCAFSFDSPPNNEPGFVKATTRDFSIDNWKMAKDPPQKISSTLLNFMFNIQDFPEDVPIYCFTGDPFNKSSEFSYIRLASAAFYGLPSFSGVPEMLGFGYYHAAIGWRQWDSSSETGDGPIVGYKVYVRSGSNVVLAEEVQSPSMVPMTDRSVSKRSAENASEMVMYNVSGLEAGSTYSVQIAAIRDGINGEGEQGPALAFTTKQVGGSAVPSGSIATAVGSAVGAILVIVIVVILIIFVYKRRSNESATAKSKGKESDSSPQHENPVFDQLETDGHTYQDLNPDTKSYENPTDPHTYQDLKKPDREANYEELNDAMKRDYVNVPGI